MGAQLRFLPPYSPDFNPIELAFAKLKAFLRAARPRTFDHVCALIAAALELFTPDRMSQLRATLRVFGRYSVMKNALIGWNTKLRVRRNVLPISGRPEAGPLHRLVGRHRRT